MITIVPPLGACSDRIRVRGGKTGSTFTVSAGLEGVIPEEVFRGSASSPDQIVVLTRRLKADERVFASDGSPGVVYAEVVQPEPDRTEVGPVNADAHLHAWGRCGAFGNCLPGAEVTVTSQTRGTLGRGAFDPQTGSARVRFSAPLGEGEVLFAEQSICGLAGPPGELPRPDRAQLVDSLLPAPSIASPPVACDRAVLVKGVAEGATVRMFRGGREYSSACVDYASTWFQFADPLVTGEKIWFDQRFPDCELHSPPSPPIDVGDPDDRSTPAILSILCPGLPEIGVGQLRFGAAVTLIQVHHPMDTIQGGAASQIGDIDAWDLACSVRLYEPLNPTRGKFVRAVQTFCNGARFHSEAKEIKPRSISKPVIVGPLFECARVVRVAEILPGARVEIYQMLKDSDGWRNLTSEQVYSTSADIKLKGGQLQVHKDANGNAVPSVFARQIACGNPVEGDRVSVAPTDLPPPRIGDCGEHLQVSGVVPGARVEIFANDAFILGDSTGGSTIYFNLDQPLVAGTILKAQQVLCNRTSVFSDSVEIRDDVVKRRLALVSTDRVCHLTGGPVSQQAGILETDLGIVVDHDTGDNWVYFFFGDTNKDVPGGFPLEKDNRQYSGGWDSIARTRSESAGDRGPEVEFLYDFQDGGPKPVIFGIHNVSQKFFEVPTGGFSHAGKLYVFASTDHAKLLSGGDVMGRSVLASAFSARDMFQVVPGYQDISSMGREQDGGFKFINIAVQKVRNDDWTHLPDNAMPDGEGLILIGSGSYRDSQPCLAYAPLRPNEEPAFTDWRYLSGFDAATRDSGLCGIPQWSVNQNDAIFLFDDWNTLTTDENGNRVPPTIDRQPKLGQVGELSIMYSPELRIWIMLYMGVFMRSAEKPWGPWSEAVEIFNFFVNGGSNFMNGPSAYGPYIIPRFTKFDPLSRELTIYYNMSIWVPYQVMLMRTVLREDCSYDDAFHCPSGGAISIPPIPELAPGNPPPSDG